MKKLLAVIMLAAVLAASGCNSNAPAETTKKPASATSASSSGKKTEIAFQSPQTVDTTEEALAYLRVKAPIFADYIEMRTKIPHSYVATITTGGVSYEYGMFIKDEHNLANYSILNGVKESVVYTPETAYQFNSSSTDMYVMKRKPETIADLIKGYLIKLDVKDIEASEYEEDTAEYEGKEYKHTLITTNGVQNHYYYDMDTEEIVYIVAPESVMHFEFMKADVTDDSAFTIPTGYNEIDYDEYIDELSRQNGNELIEQAKNNQ